jgi:LuxR family maltose regulon positive regulatory protein
MGEIYCHILTAIAHILRGERERAFSSLDAALAIALPDRLLLPFAEHYQAICPILRYHPQTAGECGAQIEMLAKRLQRGRDTCTKTLCQNTPFNLTEQEYRIACLAARGVRNPEIANRLSLSEKTVRNCLSLAYGKIGASRVKLAAALDKTGLDWESVN